MAHPAPQDVSAWDLLKRLWNTWCRPRLPLILLNLFFIFLFSATSGLYAPIIKYIVDAAQDGNSQVGSILLLALIIAFAKAGTLLAHRRLNVRLFSDIAFDMKKVMFDRMITADLAWHGREAPGALASRVVSDVEAVRTGLERITNNLIRDVLMIIAIVASMVYIDWQLALVALGVFPIAILPIANIGRVLRKVGRQTQAQIADVSARLIESLSNIHIAKTYQLEQRLNQRSGTDLGRLRELQVREGDHQALIDPIMEVLGGIAVVGVLFFVGWRLESGVNTLGDFAGFITALLLAGQPLRALGNLTAHVQRALASAQRVFQVLDDRPLIVDAANAQPLVIRQGAVNLDNVTFAYSDGTVALDDVTISVPAGKQLALVGRSGAGKSTLFNLIPRLFDVSSGSVSIDGQDIRDVQIASLRRNVALVTQDALLFNDTVRTNLALGRDDPAAPPSDEEIIAAAKSAAAHEFISSLPEGYDTIIGDRGSRLSGGQRQRLSIARAFVRDAPILLLDEATSALDAEAEAQIKEALDRLTEGRTTIVIAHRLSTIVDSDIIAVLDNGRLIELGNHSELLSKDGTYASLYRLQFKQDAQAAPSGHRTRP